MRKYIYISILCLSAGLTSCNDWLTEEGPMVTKSEDFFTNEETAVQSVNAAYVPLMWEYNNTYYPEWFIGDVVSDDALKGGQNLSDMADVYDLENFKTISNNGLLLDYYRAQYQGVARCNLAIEEIPRMEVDEKFTEKLRDRLVGEAKFLRAMYYFRLVRMFGGVPKVDYVIYSSEKWKQPRATKEEIYDLITKDLLAAEPVLWKKSEYEDTDLGRATKGAAQAMLLKVYLYMHNYTEAKKWGEFIKLQAEAGEYRLCEQYADNFTLEGENGPESVFEIQYMDEPTSDFGEGNGFTRGTFTTILTRSRSTAFGTSGWGFNKPTQNLYNEFENGDPRREISILNPTDAQITTPTEEIYLGSRYVSRKYTLMDENNRYASLSHTTRSPINNKVIRYADVLLMYAEACCETNDLPSAKSALNVVRQRARGNTPNILPDFPYGSYNDNNKEDLIKAIRHERRVELAMEGHRWFDLCRWGIAKSTMDAYKAGESAEAKAEMGDFIEGKHELFPIPQEEVNLGGLTQNSGY